MEELTPIRKIKPNYGKPLELTAPSKVVFARKIRREVAECEDNAYDAYMIDSALWEANATPEERKTFEELTAYYNKAEKAYNPKIHKDDSPEAQAYFKADEERQKFTDSTGKHICFRCSYYDARKIPADEKDPGAFPETWIALCKRTTPSLLVRPYCLACQHFTTGVTPLIEAEEKKFAEACRKNPGFAAYVRKRRSEDAARRFADQIKNEPSTAFYLYQGAPDYHEKMYNDFPLILAETQYPSFPLFLEAYKRWQQDVIITRRKGFNGAEEVKMSISKPEFKPKDMVVPPSDTKTSDN
jgi:hypothetical protein